MLPLELPSAAVNIAEEDVDCTHNLPILVREVQGSLGDISVQRLRSLLMPCFQHPESIFECI